MKEQLESLAEEMIKEIKDLKDLTKETLPELAKEYIKYNIVLNSLAIGLSILVLLVSIGLLIHGNTVENDKYGWFLGGSVVGLMATVFICAGVSELLPFIFMPRRMAIKAITRLF